MEPLDDLTTMPHAELSEKYFKLLAAPKFRRTTFFKNDKSEPISAIHYDSGRCQAIVMIWLEFNQLEYYVSENLRVFYVYSKDALAFELTFTGKTDFHIIAFGSM